MTVEKGVVENKDEQKTVLVGIRINGNSLELLNWAIAKVAEPGDRVVALNVRRDSDPLTGDNSSATICSLDDYLAVYEGFCNVKKINLVGKISWGNSIPEVLVREVKLCDATALIVGIGKCNAFGGSLSLARYCAKRLSPTISVLAIHKGKIVFQKNAPKQFSGKEDKSVLRWKMRFKVAVGVAEALTYLHSGCSRPIIHRDVKSSNILLSNEFEPQLPDFRLALWAPPASAYITYSDVGTFGYLASEYFMYGKVSVKIDVYSYGGVVLLELLSGRKPIDAENPKGQESLVTWISYSSVKPTPKLESGYTTDLLDPNMAKEYNENQMRRMVLAATLCITRTAQHRPEMIQILKLLQGVEDVVEWAKSEANVPKEADLQDEEAYPVPSVQSHNIDLKLLEIDDDASSLSSIEHNHHNSLEDYLRGRQSGSSNYD